MTKQEYLQAKFARIRQEHASFQNVYRAWIWEKNQRSTLVFADENGQIFQRQPNGDVFRLPEK